MPSSFKLEKGGFALKKSNGFSLLESLFSLSMLSLIVLSLLPMIIQMKQQLHEQNQKTTAFQLLAEESKFHIDTLASTNYKTTIKKQPYQITYSKEANKLCAAYAKEKMCYSLK